VIGPVTTAAGLLRQRISVLARTPPYRTGPLHAARHRTCGRNTRSSRWYRDDLRRNDTVRRRWAGQCRPDVGGRTRCGWTSRQRLLAGQRRKPVRDGIRADRGSEDAGSGCFHVQPEILEFGHVRQFKAQSRLARVNPLPGQLFLPTLRDRSTTWQSSVLGR